MPKSSSGNPKANENHKDGDRKAKRNGSHLEIFSTLLTAMAGPKVVSAEVTKLTTQYGKGRVASFVTVQNYAVDDAVRLAQKAGVKFPTPTLHGKALAATVVKLGLEDGTYYEGVQLDHLVTHAIHEHVMDDIDQKYGTAADANYHRIADQAHYDLGHALGMTNVKLASYH